MSKRKPRVEEQSDASPAQNAPQESVSITSEEVGSLEALGFVGSVQPEVQPEAGALSGPDIEEMELAAHVAAETESFSTIEAAANLARAIIAEEELAAIAAAETQILPRADDAESKSVLEYQAFDDTHKLRDIPPGTAENPYGTLDSSKRFHWIGRDIMGIHCQGSSDDTAGCYADSTKAGCVMCDPRANPEWQEPAPAPEATPLTEYQKGWNDADAAYQDLKALIQNFAAIQAAETNDDVDLKYPFVAYVRHNR